MIIDQIKLYHLLPYPLKVLLASAKGYFLYHQRYGPHTQQLVEEASERESWKATRWDDWQHSKLERILHLAATQVPYYRAYWDKQRSLGDRSSFYDLNNWPVLTKNEVRKNPTAFLCDGVNTNRLYEEHTSGSTGMPLRLWIKFDDLGKWYALFICRWLEWYGQVLGRNWGVIGGQQVAAFDRTKPPYWVWNWSGKQLYLSCYHISLDNARHYLTAIKNHNLKYMVVYPSAMYNLAYYLNQFDLRSNSLKFILSNAEPLYPYQKEMIEEVFNCPVYNSYGLAESIIGASECVQGHALHLWPDAGVTENLAINQDSPQEAGKPGRIIATGLINTAMPLIRYETGDIGIMNNDNACKCGRKMPIINQITGRLADCIVTKDGRLISRLAHVTEAGLPIIEMQIVQESLERINVYVVSEQLLTTEHREKITDLIHQRVGDIPIVVKQVKHIKRSANGKFRSVISKVNSQDFEMG